MPDALLVDADLPRTPREILPGVVHVPGWLDPEQQRWLVARFHEWGRGPVPPHSPLINGFPMSVKTTSLGWTWDQGGIRARTAEGTEPWPVPDWLVRVGRMALQDAYDRRTAPSWPDLPAAELQQWAQAYAPDVAVINYYSPTARMGMHQDKDERSPEPVVSLSVGDTCIFRAGNTQARTQPYQDLRLASGDLLVFGGPHRQMFHGVPKILPDTAPRHCGLERGRINITLRTTGMHHAHRTAR